MGGHDESLKTVFAWLIRVSTPVFYNELRESAEHLPVPRVDYTTGL